MTNLIKTKSHIHITQQNSRKRQIFFIALFYLARLGPTGDKRYLNIIHEKITRKIRKYTKCGWRRKKSREFMITQIVLQTKRKLQILYTSTHMLLIIILHVGNTILFFVYEYVQ